MKKLLTVEEYCEFYREDINEINQLQLQLIIDAVSDYLRGCFIAAKIGDLDDRILSGRTSKAIVKLCVSEIVKKQYNALQKGENTNSGFDSMSQSIGDYSFSFSNPANPMTIPLQYKKMLGLNKLTIKNIPI